MIATLAIAPLLLAQAATAQMVQQEQEKRDVAYEQIAQGDLDGAIVALETALREEPNDPATLINLGSAHQLRGNRELAARYFRAALESETRYDMELANGRWLDSRRVAALALRSLDNTRIALR